MQGRHRMLQDGGLYTHSFGESDDEAALSVAVGDAYRWKDAFIPILKLYTHNFGIGLSYDVNKHQQTNNCLAIQPRFWVIVILYRFMKQTGREPRESRMFFKDLVKNKAVPVSNRGTAK